MLRRKKKNMGGGIFGWMIREDLAREVAFKDR